MAMETRSFSTSLWTGKEVIKFIDSLSYDEALLSAYDIDQVTELKNCILKDLVSLARFNNHSSKPENVNEPLPSFFEEQRLRMGVRLEAHFKECLHDPATVGIAVGKQVLAYLRLYVNDGEIAALAEAWRRFLDFEVKRIGKREIIVFEFRFRRDAILEKVVRRRRFDEAQCLEDELNKSEPQGRAGSEETASDSGDEESD